MVVELQDNSYVLHFCKYISRSIFQTDGLIYWQFHSDKRSLSSEAASSLLKYTLFTANTRTHEHTNKELLRFRHKNFWETSKGTSNLVLTLHVLLPAETTVTNVMSEQWHAPLHTDLAKATNCITRLYFMYFCTHYNLNILALIITYTNNLLDFHQYIL